MERLDSHRAALHALEKGYLGDRNQIKCDIRPRRIDAEFEGKPCARHRASVARRVKRCWSDRQAQLVEPDHPVPQGLTIHPADPRGLRA